MEQDFTIAEFIELMRKTKKTDPLFKPLKKIKTALESIGIANVSFSPTSRVLAFHFGLGNQLDQQFLKLSQPHQLAREIEIIPGSSYCILQFESRQHSAVFVSGKQQMDNKPVFYEELTYQNLTRVLIFLFSKEQFLKNNEILAIPNCDLTYKPETIPGLIIVEDIISKEEELQLLQHIDGGKWDRLNNRRVQHHGYSFKYGRNQVDKDQQEGHIPQYFNHLLHKLAALQPLKHSKFDQLTINDYFAGNGIPSHFDTHSPFQQIFISVSLLSGIVMDFRKYDGEQHCVYLKQRSLAIFSARYAWTHGIGGRKVDKLNNKVVYRSRRVSLTFRQIRFSPCTCQYYFYCDSQGYNQETMKKHNPLLTKFMSEQANHILVKRTPKEIEKQFVEKAYNGFGFDFHNKVISQVRTFLQNQLQDGDLLLDIGCGNGEYSKYVKDGVYYVGIQKCTVMVPVQNEVFMDCLNLSFRDATFDSVIFIAVLHHLASEQSRIKALRQVSRVLKSKGSLYLSVLSFEKKREIYSRPDVLLEYCLPANKVQQNNKVTSNIDRQEPRIQQRGEVYSRYYHLFSQEQIGYLLQKAGFYIAEVLQDKENFIVRAINQIF